MIFFLIFLLLLSDGVECEGRDGLFLRLLAIIFKILAMADFEPILAIKMSSVKHQVIKCHVKGDLFRSEALQIPFHNSSKVE